MPSRYKKTAGLAAIFGRTFTLAGSGARAPCRKGGLQLRPELAGEKPAACKITDAKWRGIFQPAAKIDGWPCLETLNLSPSGLPSLDRFGLRRPLDFGMIQKRCSPTSR
jgi:hypothetical protein